ncbi:MAG: hypothetical protein GY848_16730 [Methyloversatilis sp.]|uniref:hypothetical protein n=1 Tax=Paracoccus marcusii TaxID=59779 RepID=UPI001C3CA3D0|nr:hypothetical protein [Paracoccus marcusii]MCP4638108.1 hypothetical protein [Methyloversatilis sp.]QXI63796.1 hypothetical protein CP157_01521 [Paracoccus marcusii]
MANSRSDRSLSQLRAPKASARPDAPVLRSEAKPKPTAVSRANEIVRAIGLRPITGLSGPKIGY